MILEWTCKRPWRFALVTAWFLSTSLYLTSLMGPDHIGWALLFSVIDVIAACFMYFYCADRFMRWRAFGEKDKEDIKWLIAQPLDP